MDYKVEIHKLEHCFRGFFTLDRLSVSHALFAGGMSEPLQREMIHHGDAVAILCYDPAMDAIVVIEQFRIGAIADPQGAWVHELVAGFQEPGESIEEVIHRELREEAGVIANRYESIACYYSNPANSSDKVHLYCACVDASTAGGIHGVKEEGEDIRVHVIAYHQIADHVQSGKLASATPIIAVQWLQLNRARLLTEWKRG